MGGQSFTLDSSGMDSMASPEDAMEIDDSTEWEYEYDENETEDFYFTVDITKPAPAKPPKTPKPKPQANGTASTAPPDTTPGAAQPTPKPGSRPGTSQATTIPSGKVEFLSLDHANPQLKLDDQLYSCHWSTDLGTQVHVARSGTTKKPLRSGRVLDVVGITRTRLIAKPAQGHVEKKDAVGTRGMSAADSMSIDRNDGIDFVAQASADVSKMQTRRTSKARETATDPKSDSIKSFREQLDAIKMKKSVANNSPASGTPSQNPP